MNIKVKYWQTKAKQIAAAEGLKGLRFYPLDREAYYRSPMWMTGTFNRFSKSVTFCIRRYDNRSAMSNLLHELAHAKDFENRGWIREKQFHDKAFNREWDRLRRKYQWK